MTISLPDLPYALDALEPAISKNTLEFHYGKHHRAYVDNLNKMIAGSDLESKSLEDIILASAQGTDAKAKGIFNNAAQVWNHTFYWNSLTPKGGAPKGDVVKKIEADFGSIDSFKEQFADAAKGQFGSGWAWLVVGKGGKLEIVKTGNAETPIVDGKTPLLTIDVWEHAYYLDYQNRRPDYVSTVIDKLLNWDFANENLARALAAA